MLTNIGYTGRMLVYHIFESLSEADSGKQHKFSWYTDDGRFICNAMYQSGADDVPLGNGQSAPRGKTLRLQFDERASTAPGHGDIIQVDGDKWDRTNYTNMLTQIECMPSLNAKGDPLQAQKKAVVMAQLSSLYNLMATRYGDVFLHEQAIGLSIPQEYSSKGWERSVDELITSPKMKALSQWMRQHALKEMGQPHKAASAPALPPSDHASIPLIPTMWLHHDILTQAGKKKHQFAFQHGPREITATIYQSGAQQGETVGILQRRIRRDKNPRPKPEAFEIKVGTEHEYFPPDAKIAALQNRQLSVHPGTVVSPEYNAHKLKEALEKNEITKEQCAAALIMLASTCRLVATRYNGPFGYDWNGERLPPSLHDHMGLGGATAEEKSKVHDYFITNGQRYHRPVHIHDGASLDCYIADPALEQATQIYIGLAGDVLTGKELKLTRLGKILAEHMGYWSPPEQPKIIR